MTRYALSAGKVDDNSLRNKPMLYQGHLAAWPEQHVYRLYRRDRF